jgi:type III secretory pathway component EscR
MKLNIKYRLWLRRYSLRIDYLILLSFLVIYIVMLAVLFAIGIMYYFN